MIETLADQLAGLLALGQDASERGAVAVALRTLLVYAVALAIVRLGSKRFISRATAFDVIVAIMLGSILSSAITGSTAFGPTLVGGAVLVGAHAIIAWLSAHFDQFGTLVKGAPVVLIRDGEVQPDGMRRSGISRGDLEEAVRLQGHQPDPSRVRVARLERSGRISVLPCEDEPRVLVVGVEEGVQTIRIELR
jgi:uncharacterized membrane protein YcaP (DUF421 family)